MDQLKHCRGAPLFCYSLSGLFVSIHDCHILCHADFYNELALLSPPMERSEYWRRLWDWSICPLLLLVLCLSVCLYTRHVIHNWHPPVKTSTLVEIMHSHERLLVITMFFYSVVLFNVHGFGLKDSKKNMDIIKLSIRGSRWKLCYFDMMFVTWFYNISHAVL